MSGAQIVAIFNRWAVVPVYHLHAPGIQVEDEGIIKSRWWGTRCGRKIHAWGWTDVGATTAGSPTRDHWSSDKDAYIDLRRDHADKFARVCKLCAKHE